MNLYETILDSASVFKNLFVFTGVFRNKSELTGGVVWTVKVARGRAEEKGGSGAAAGLGCSTAFVGGAVRG
uniref:Putative ovule protein n=1 Tax=Solanum chacoense TaxID=4108 RepID=A0A0V0I3Z3_SOLCH